jgi:hypothetical protein
MCSQNNRRVGFVDAIGSDKLLVVSRFSGKVHVVRVKKTHLDKQGSAREYSSAYLRRTYREGKRVRNETVANLSMLPEHVVDGIDAGLKGQRLVPVGGEFTIAGSLPHGHVAAVAVMARKLGLPTLLGAPCRGRDLALALIISRGGPTPPWGSISGWRVHLPTRSMRRWTGWSAGRTASKSSWWHGIWIRR